MKCESFVQGSETNVRSFDGNLQKPESEGDLCSAVNERVDGSELLSIKLFKNVSSHLSDIFIQVAVIFSEHVFEV